MADERLNKTRRSRIDRDPKDLATELERLYTLDFSELRAQWAMYFPNNPSVAFGPKFMIKAIAYRLQEKAFSGLKPSTQRMLDRVADRGSKVSQSDIQKKRPDAGTVLLREWHGVSHRVTVLDEEVVYRGQRYNSLSEVARTITGTRWSGPLFFGLKACAKEANGA